MVYRVVSTKLTEDEHNALIEECNKHGLSPSALIREAILETVSPTVEKPKTELNAQNSANARTEGNASLAVRKVTPESELMKFMRLCRAQKQKQSLIPSKENVQ